MNTREDLINDLPDDLTDAAEWLGRRFDQVAPTVTPRRPPLAAVTVAARPSARTRIGSLAAAAAVAAVLVGVLAVSTSRSPDDLGVQSGPNAGPTAGATATTPDTTFRTTWTVNSSIVMGPEETDIWALRIVYDPAVWDFDRFRREIDVPRGGVSAIVGGTENGEHVIDAYATNASRQFVGRTPEEIVTAVRDQLRPQAGIISVEVAPAVEVPRPGTVVPPGTDVWTGASLSPG